MVEWQGSRTARGTWEQKRSKLAMSKEEGSVHSDEASYQWEVSSGPQPSLWPWRVIPAPVIRTGCQNASITRPQRLLLYANVLWPIFAAKTFYHLFSVVWVQNIKPHSHLCLVIHASPHCSDFLFWSQFHCSSVFYLFPVGPLEPFIINNSSY